MNMCITDQSQKHSCDAAEKTASSACMSARGEATHLQENGAPHCALSHNLTAGTTDDRLVVYFLDERR